MGHLRPRSWRSPVADCLYDTASKDMACKKKVLVLRSRPSAPTCISVCLWPSTNDQTFCRINPHQLFYQLTIQNSILEEIKIRLRSGNACYHSVQNLLSSRLLSKKLKIKIYRTIILPVVLYGCEAWSLTLREERKPRVFENMVLRRIFGPRREEVTG